MPTFTEWSYHRVLRVPSAFWSRSLTASVTCQYSPQSVASLFSLVTVPFKEQMSHISLKSNLFFCYVFGVI